MTSFLPCTLVFAESLYGGSPVNRGIPLTGVKRKWAIFQTFFLFTVVFFQAKDTMNSCKYNTIADHLSRKVFSQSRVLLKIVYIHGFDAFRNATLLFPCHCKNGSTHSMF